MFIRKHIFLAPEDDDGTGGSEGDGEDTSETGDGEDEGEAGEGEEEQEGTEGSDDESEGSKSELDISTLPAHLQELAALNPDQVKALYNNATAFDQLRADPEFNDFFKRVVARAAGIDLPAPSNGKAQRENGPDPTEMSDKEVLTSFIGSVVEEQVTAILSKLNPMIEDFSQRKLKTLKDQYPDFEQLVPKVEAFKRENSWAAQMPFDEVIKLLTFDSAGDHAINNLKKKGRIGGKPRGGGVRGKSKLTQKQINKMSTAELMESIAQEQGVKLQE